MIIVRLYAVLGAPVLEATCWHGDGPGGSHMLYRQEGSVGIEDPVELLEFCSEGLAFCARQIVMGDIDVTDDCPYV